MFQVRKEPFREASIRKFPYVIVYTVELECVSRLEKEIRSKKQETRSKKQEARKL